MYDPDFIEHKDLYSYSQKEKEEILQRDGYKCQWCGRGKEDGVELQIDHIIPLDKGGKNTIDNAQILCSRCNFVKKTYSQREFGKRMMIKLYQKAVDANDKTIIKFCKCVFNCYDKYNINGHIPSPNSEKET